MSVIHPDECALASLPQNNTHVWPLRHSLHHPRQHPLHLCHLLLHQSENTEAPSEYFYSPAVYLKITVIIIFLQPSIANGINPLSVLSDPLLAVCIPALPSCLSDRNQENRPVSHKQHAGVRLHHPPPLRFILCKHGTECEHLLHIFFSHILLIQPHSLYLYSA